MKYRDNLRYQLNICVAVDSSLDSSSIAVYVLSSQLWAWAVSDRAVLSFSWVEDFAKEGYVSWFVKIGNVAAAINTEDTYY